MGQSVARTDKVGIIEMMKLAKREIDFQGALAATARATDEPEVAEHLETALNIAETKRKNGSISRGPFNR